MGQYKHVIRDVPVISPNQIATLDANEQVRKLNAIVESQEEIINRLRKDVSKMKQQLDALAIKSVKSER